MKEKIDEGLRNAEELINLRNEKIMALSLGKNEKHADNYQMAMTIRLRKSLERLNNEKSRKIC